MEEPHGDIAQEIADLVGEAIRNELARLPQVQFPDTQKVEVTNAKDPVVNVNVPDVIVPEIKLPTINVPKAEVSVQLPEIPENVSSNALLTEIRELLKDTPKPSNEDIVEALKQHGESIIEAYKKHKVVYGGSGGIASYIYNASSVAINPATEEKQGDTVSTVNSSTTALNNGENFTGTWEDADGYSSVKVAVKTDQNGYYEIQFSPDGTNVDSTLTRYYRTTQIEPPHKFEIMRQYVRVRFFNDSGSNQTYFRLQTIFSHSAGMLNIPVDANMSQDYDATATRPTDFKYEVSLGRRQGYSLFNKFGYNTDVDTGTDPEVVAAFGGTSFTPLTTASTLTIVSSSSDDDGDPAGTGAQTILITGIDTNRDFQQEIVTLNGTTNVVTTSTWLGINRAVVVTSGSNDANVGNITITATTGGSTQAFIPIGQSVTQQLIFFNYRNHIALIEFIELNALRFGSGAEPTVTFKGWVYSGLVDTKYEIFRESVNTNIQTNFQLDLPLPLPLTEQDVFWIEAETTRDDTSVSGRFSLVTVRDVDA